MPFFNGKFMFHRAVGWKNVYVDASMPGGGMLCDTEWMYVHWASDLPLVEEEHINVKESLIILLAVRRWSPTWVNCSVIVQGDNITARAALNKGKSHSCLAMREIFWLSSLFNFRIRGVHISGHLNVGADAISRLHQPGALSRLEACLGVASDLLMLIWPFVLMGHMSTKAFVFVFPQLLKWARCHRNCVN